MEKTIPRQTDRGQYAIETALTEQRIKPYETTRQGAQASAPLSAA